MVNKLWYDDKDEDTIFAREDIQDFINLYCFNSTQFQVVEDITPENLAEFLKIMLRHYELYHFDTADFAYKLGESLDLYLHRAYKDEFPDTCYPTYPDYDRRSLAINTTDYIYNSRYTILPEDVSYLIDYLNTPEGKVVEAEAVIENYFAQFDHMKRCNIESKHRWKIINQQRIEAIEKNQPLPIRPMGIKLDMCYKKDKDDLG